MYWFRLTGSFMITNYNTHFSFFAYASYNRDQLSAVIKSEASINIFPFQCNLHSKRNSHVWSCSHAIWINFQNAEQDHPPKNGLYCTPNITNITSIIKSLVNKIFIYYCQAKRKREKTNGNEKKHRFSSKCLAQQNSSTSIKIYFLVWFGHPERAHTTYTTAMSSKMTDLRYWNRIVYGT